MTFQCPSLVDPLPFPFPELHNNFTIEFCDIKCPGIQIRQGDFQAEQLGNHILCHRTQQWIWNDMCCLLQTLLSKSSLKIDPDMRHQTWLIKKNFVTRNWNTNTKNGFHLVFIWKDLNIKKLSRKVRLVLIKILFVFVSYTFRTEHNSQRKWLQRWHKVLDWCKLQLS